MPEVDAVIGNLEKLDAANLAATAANLQVGAPWDLNHAFAPPRLDGYADRTRAFLQIQQGCDHSCTFCIVPQARGPNRSAAPENPDCAGPHAGRRRPC